ncbi:MAG TPA: EAL domain-containing protein [Rhodospirillaceae bacterium]|nr:EAL domain-containing protein [Rhodospirillaceae bacterium]
MNEVRDKNPSLSEFLSRDSIFDAALNSVPFQIAVLDRQGVIVAVNDAWRQFALDNCAQPDTAAANTGIGTNYLDICRLAHAPEESQARDAFNGIQAVLEGRLQSFTMEYPCDSPWEKRWFSMVVSPLGRSEIKGVVVTHTNITQIKQASEQLRIAAVAFESHEGMVITDADGTILNVNQAFIETTGYSAEEIIGQSPRMLKSGRHSGDFYREMWDSLKRCGVWQGEVWDRRKNGEIYPKWLTISAVKDDQGKITHYVGAHFDNTELKLRDAKIEELAFFDQLTGLPNRRLFEDRLKHGVFSAGRDRKKLGLLILDLDRFKEVNDTLGHNVGDGLLQDVAQRIKGCLRTADTPTRMFDIQNFARLGGDEFVILIDDVSQPEDCAVVAQKVIAAVSQPIVIKAHTIHVSASVGIALYPDDGEDGVMLMRAAETAMYAAKNAGRQTYRFFQAKMSETAMQRGDIESCLRLAMANQELTLHYQPKVDAKSRKTVGYEALLRWNSARLGSVSPASFIPIAEDAGLIGEIGSWVIEETCRQIAAWQAAGYGLMEVAINVSAHQLKGGNLAEQISEACRRHAIPTASLEVELTESVVMTDPRQAIRIFQELRELGLRVAIDDFGTGYSSLAYLRRLPIDVLKIDRSFVMEADRDEDDAEIVRTILSLGKTLKLELVAEGVETEAQASLLNEAGCDIFQGYLFSRPLPSETIEQSFAKDSKPMLRKITRAVIVEDSPQSRDLIQMAMDLFGVAETVDAEDGTQAIKALKGAPTDIVIMDWKMSGMDGLECTRQIRAGISGIDPKIPIILVTGVSDKGAEKEAYAAGVDFFIKKPFSLKQLRDGLQTVLGVSATGQGDPV